jgi:hypothetical protein
MKPAEERSEPIAKAIALEKQGRTLPDEEPE